MRTLQETNLIDLKQPTSNLQTSNQRINRAEYSTRLAVGSLVFACLGDAPTCQVWMALPLDLVSKGPIPLHDLCTVSKALVKK